MPGCWERDSVIQISVLLHALAEDRGLGQIGDVILG